MDGQYNNPYNYNQYGFQSQQVKKPIWAAVTSFVLSIVNIVFCCCMTYILAPLSIIFGIVSLAKKWAGKGLAVAGIIISSVSLVLMIISSVFMNTTFKEPYQDMMKFAASPDKYIEEYQETGEVPEDFQKYCSSEYDNWWKFMGYDRFEDFFDDYIKGFMSTYRGYNNNTDNDKSGNESQSDRDKFFDDYGEKPVEL